ncbi:serine hydrolase [Thiobaca trueperi]|uniref:D-alanyl-D-alanine endopeptidase (Penicillin-binding protein 7) n=1 Tax=Thiobaca trueperi TaxID=127458 RepID=A0A4R3N759_9GAMM|nr:serine hydrolase [Thiobaca trueperi]TCT24241.1 D-alanyl-D-alanine endopeptidase (penicillin-binding protein 7) [Thiobaca trueperi]
MPRLHALPSLPRTSFRLLPDKWGRSVLLTVLFSILILSGTACASNHENQSAAAPVANAQTWSQTASGSDLDHWMQTNQRPRPNSWSQLNRSLLHLQSASALIVDEDGNRLYSKNTQQIKPIASVTKLMTAMVVLDAGVPMNTPIKIIEDDRDRLRNSRSRLRINEATLSRGEMITVAVMSSDNRAAHALGRTTFRGGTPAFINAMNRKAKSLGMYDTYFEDSSGLNGNNRSSAEDLVKMVKAAATYPFLREITARGQITVYPFANGTALQYRNTNPLVRDPDWQIDVSKTGFINEAGHCLVMQTRIGDRRVYMVFLDSAGRQSPVGDSNRVRNWILTGHQTAAR